MKYYVRVSYHFVNLTLIAKMAWRTLKRLSSYFRVDDIGYITKTTGILLGIVLYDKFRRDRIAYAKHSSTSTNDSFSTLSSNSSNIKWNNNWDMYVYNYVLNNYHGEHFSNLVGLRY